MEWLLIITIIFCLIIGYHIITKGKESNEILRKKKLDQPFLKNFSDIYINPLGYNHEENSAAWWGKNHNYCILYSQNVKDKSKKNILVISNSHFDLRYSGVHGYINSKIQEGTIKGKLVDRYKISVKKNGKIIGLIDYKKKIITSGRGKNISFKVFDYDNVKFPRQAKTNVVMKRGSFSLCKINVFDFSKKKIFTEVSNKITDNEKILALVLFLFEVTRRHITYSDKTLNAPDEWFN